MNHTLLFISCKPFSDILKKCDIHFHFICTIFYHDWAVRSLGIPFFANRRCRLPWRHHWNAVYCRSATHVYLCTSDTVTIAAGIPDSIVIFRLIDWKGILQIVSWAYTMTVYIDSRFKTVVKCVHLKVCFFHVGASRGRTLFTFIYPCGHRTSIATFSPRTAALTWSWWYDLTVDISASKLHGLIPATILNNRCRMGLDPVFASGAHDAKTWPIPTLSVMHFVRS